MTYSNPNHAFYVSVTDVEYEPKQKVLQVQVKIFTNDLEDEIRNQNSQIIRLQDGINSTEAGRVYRYILEKMEVSVDGETLFLEKIACKLEGDAVFTQYQGKLGLNPKMLKVENALLLDLFPTQTNIVRLKNKGKQKILKLNKGEKVGELQF